MCIRDRSVAPSNPEIVYAFIEAKTPTDGLYRSNDGGKTWEQRDRSFNMVWRPFYFSNVIVDPTNPERLFKTDLSLILSTDGGNTFSNVQSGSHGDFHDVWIDPTN